MTTFRAVLSSLMNKPQNTRCFSDLVYEVILLSPIWGIALIYGWKEISKFIDAL